MQSLFRSRSHYLSHAVIITVTQSLSGSRSHYHVHQSLRRSSIIITVTQSLSQSCSHYHGYAVIISVTQSSSRLRSHYHGHAVIISVTQSLSRSRSNFHAFTLGHALALTVKLSPTCMISRSGCHGQTSILIRSFTFKAYSTKR